MEPGAFKFDWDDAKAAANLSKHGVDFDEAKTVFYDSLAGAMPDPDHSIGEERLFTIGLSRMGRTLIVSHTERGQFIRIISAREATRQEKVNYER